MDWERLLLQQVVCHYREVVWPQKQELGLPRLTNAFRMTLLRDIRTCTKSWKSVSSRKLRFSNFLCYAGLHSLLIK